MSSPEGRVDAFTEIRDRLRRFAEERDWDQFHSPKNLAMALVVETSELLERFQWLTDDESKALTAEQREAVAQELADVQVYLVRLADKLGIDIREAVSQKLELNAAKYPVDKARGNSRKYTEL